MELLPGRLVVPGPYVRPCPSQRAAKPSETDSPARLDGVQWEHVPAVEPKSLSTTLAVLAALGVRPDLSALTIAADLGDQGPARNGHRVVSKFSIPPHSKRPVSQLAS